VVLGFESGAATFDPDLMEFSTLDFVDHLHGYWFRMDSPAELCVVGIQVDEQTPIMLESNWNLVSYLPPTDLETETALGSIWSEFIVALGFMGGGLVYDINHPDMATLEFLSRGYGYWVKVTDATTLIYPNVNFGSSYYSYGGAMTVIDTPKDVTPTPLWIDVYAEEIRLDDRPLPAGAKVSFVDEQGQLCGVGTIQSNSMLPFTPIYFDDPASRADEGATMGERLKILVDGLETEESLICRERGDRIALGGLHSRTSTAEQIPLRFELAQNYPNPFNPTTVISFSLPQATTARLEVYNILGERVATLIDEYLPAGDYRISWDGSLTDGEVAPSGIYFYRLSSDDHSITKKMLLVK
jgi:hypothetical protein